MSGMVSLDEQPDAARPRSRRRFTGLMPNRLLRWRRPVWWQELAIIGIGYYLYTRTRNGFDAKPALADRHGLDIQQLQDDLHLNFELSINHFVANHEWLAQFLDYYYATMHFIVTIAVMVWLFVKRPHIYRGARTALFVTTLVGLLGFYLYPLTPPRLLQGYDYIDTLVKFQTWGSLADPKIAEHSNQYAAMPSLHMAWALWCGISIFVCARRTWVRWLGSAYPLLTLTAIVGTANHYIIDAVGGAVVIAIGYGIQRLLSAHGAYTAPVDAPDFGLPDPPLPSLPHLGDLTNSDHDPGGA